MKPADGFLNALTGAAASPADDDEGGGELRYRSVWVSDVHLGTPGCQAHALLDFLRRVESEHLFLVGDIIDGWQLRRSWYWPQAHKSGVPHETGPDHRRLAAPGQWRRRHPGRAGRGHARPRP